VGDQARGIGVRQSDRRDRIVEFTDLRVEPGE
jgi:hypothetical protein